MQLILLNVSTSCCTCDAGLQPTTCERRKDQDSETHPITLDNVRLHPPVLWCWLADDHVYEARKEREAEEDEARKGAAAALSHNEFMYV
jgi:hypothetical protein